MHLNVKGLTLMLAVLLAVNLVVLPATALCDPNGNGNGIDITKQVICGSDPMGGLARGQKYTWRSRITVTVTGTPGDIFSDVTVFDRLGAEFMLEGIGGYIVAYSDYPPQIGDDVTIDGETATLTKKTELSVNDFVILWTGKSLKVHLKWIIGDLTVGAGGTASASLVVKISTDENPAGKQEFTSPGCYFLNSGATVKAITPFGYQVSAETGRLVVHVDD